MQIPAVVRTSWFVALASGLIGFGLGAATLGLVRSDDEPMASESPAGSSGEETVEETDAPSVLTDEDDSAGLYLKLVQAERVQTITYSGDTISDLTPDGEPVTKRATDGGYYLVVATDGRNGTKAPIDLTCSYPIDIAVFDTEGAKYSPIDGLSQIEGNPGCNEMVQPGQRFKEKFIFLMPAGSKPDQLTWVSIDDDLEDGPQAGIDLSGK